MRERFCVKGNSPERVLSRLTRLGVVVYSAKKIDATSLYFEVERRGAKVVFAAYPKGSAYEIVRLPARGLLRACRRLSARVGVVLGGLLFTAITCYADGLVLRIKVEAPTVYLSQVEATLKESGVKKYAAYPKEKEDEICAKLLSLDRVSYCTIEKRGSVLKVVVKESAFFQPTKRQDLYAERGGRVEKIVLLCGTSKVKVGDSVAIGDKLIEGKLYDEQGGWQEVVVVGYVVLACTYEATYQAAGEEEAKAQALLFADIAEKQAKLSHCIIQKHEGNYTVTLSYTWTQRIGI